MQVTIITKHLYLVNSFGWSTGSFVQVVRVVWRGRTRKWTLWGKEQWKGQMWMVTDKDVGTWQPCSQKDDGGGEGDVSGLTPRFVCLLDLMDDLWIWTSEKYRGQQWRRHCSRNFPQGKSDLIENESSTGVFSIALNWNAYSPYFSVIVTQCDIDHFVAQWIQHIMGHLRAMWKNCVHKLPSVIHLVAKISSVLFKGFMPSEKSLLIIQWAACEGDTRVFGPLTFVQCLL